MAVPRSYLIFVASSSTYDHRILRTRLPVRSALFKQDTGGLVVRWVTTSESPLLYVFFLQLQDTFLLVALGWRVVFRLLYNTVKSCFRCQGRTSYAAASFAQILVIAVNRYGHN